MQMQSNTTEALSEERRRLIQASIDQLLQSRRGRDALDGLHQFLQCAGGLDQFNVRAVLNLLELSMGPCPMTVADMMYQALNATDRNEGYPAAWPKCPGCGKPALDGHVTCGNAACGPEAAYR